MIKIGEIMALGKVTFNRGNGGVTHEIGRPLDTGSYVAILEKVESTEQKEFEGDGTYPAISFTFRVSDEEGDSFISRHDRLSLGDLANLRKDLIAMAGKKAIEAIEVEDDQVIIDLINSMVGHQFLISVEAKVSRKGNPYHKFVSIAQLPTAKKRSSVVVKQEVQDDIPF